MAGWRRDLAWWQSSDGNSDLGVDERSDADGGVNQLGIDAEAALACGARRDASAAVLASEAAWGWRRTVVPLQACPVVPVAR